MSFLVIRKQNFFGSLAKIKVPENVGADKAGMHHSPWIYFPFPEWHKSSRENLSTEWLTRSKFPGRICRFRGKSRDEMQNWKSRVMYAAFAYGVPGKVRILYLNPENPSLWRYFASRMWRSGFASVLAGVSSENWKSCRRIRPTATFPQLWTQIRSRYILP